MSIPDGIAPGAIPRGNPDGPASAPPTLTPPIPAMSSKFIEVTFRGTYTKRNKGNQGIRG